MLSKWVDKFAKLFGSQVRLSNEFADHLLSVINGSLYKMGQQDVRNME